MNRFVKIGPDVINLDCVTRAFRLESQSGISDRVIIEVGSSNVIVDSVAGQERMDRIWKKLLTSLNVEDWDVPGELPSHISAEAA